MAKKKNVEVAAQVPLCPLCGEMLCDARDVADFEVDEVVVCESCGNSLSVVGTSPLVLETNEEDDEDEDEDDDEGDSDDEDEEDEDEDDDEDDDDEE